MPVAATHTHTAPSVMDYTLGCRADPAYTDELPPLLAKVIVEAAQNVQPAEVGAAVIQAPEHTNCRRWILRPARMRSDPFGERTVRAHMHPGYQNSDFVGQLDLLRKRRALPRSRRRERRRVLEARREDQAGKPRPSHPAGGGLLESESGPSQFGRVRDDWGH